MTEFLVWLPTSGWQRLAADAFWQSTALAAAGLTLAWFVRRRAALRAAVLLAAAVLSVVAPMLSSAVRATGNGMLAQPAAALQSPIAVAAPQMELEPPLPVVSDAPAVNLSPVARHTQPAHRSLAVARSSTGVWPWLAGFWLVASGVLTLRLLRGLVIVRRWIRSAEPCHDPEILAALARAAAAVSVAPPEVLHCPAFDTPALVAFGRPRLLVPLAMARGVDWYVIFCHELAHLARRDGMSRLAVELSVVLLPWQLLLWLTRSWFRAACEEACDDWAVAGGAEPLELASLLLTLVPTSRPALAVGMAESPATTRRRILRLVGMKRPSPPRLGRVATALGWALAIAMGLLLAVTQFTGPRSSSWFRSSTLASRAAPPWGNEPLADAVARAAATLPKTVGRPAPYVINAPDILQIEVVKLVPRNPYRVESDDSLEVHVANPLIDQPINNIYPVDLNGEISLGPAYGNVKVSGLTLAEIREAIDVQLRVVLRDPQIAVTLAKISSLRPIPGERLVAPDGTINLGTYGIVYVAGKTISQATDAIESQLSKKLDHPQASVDVYSYNSKMYYLVIEEPQGDHLIRSPFTGAETVLDALAKGLADRSFSDPADYWVWIARPVGSAASDSGSPALEPASKRDVFAGGDGVVAEVLVKQGQFVKQGDVLARLSNAELENSIVQALVQLTQTQKKLADFKPAKSVVAAPDENVAPPDEPPTTPLNKPRIQSTIPNALADEFPESSDESSLDGLAPNLAELEMAPPADDSGMAPGELEASERVAKERLASLVRRRERLTVTSPVDGQVMTARLGERLVHKNVRQGEMLMSIGEAADDAEPAVQKTPAQPATKAAESDARDHILPVDWQQVVEGTDTTSNWPLKAGDRIFVRQKPGR